MKMPATTMVAAWIRADTGVGPAMASGSHTWRMNWPDFDITAAINEQEATSSTRWLISPLTAFSLISRMLKEPAAKKRMITPQIRPTSPTRLVMNALSAASEFGFSSHQCPMSANEHRPTSSQHVSSWRVLSLMISPSIEAVNSDRNAK